MLSVIIFLNFASLALILFFDKFSKQIHKNVPKNVPQQNISTNIVTILQSKNEGDIRELIISKNIYLCQVLRMINMKEFRVEDLEERRAINKLFLKVQFFYKINWLTWLSLKSWIWLKHQPIGKKNEIHKITITFTQNGARWKNCCFEWNWFSFWELLSFAKRWHNWVWLNIQI